MAACGGAGKRGGAVQLVKAGGVLNTQVVLTGVEPPPSANIAPRPRPENQAPSAAAPQYPNPNAAPNDSIDNQAYGAPRYQQRAPRTRNQTYGSNDDRYPAPVYPRYQQRAPTDDQRYAQ